jgi:hypothetical protein
MKRTPKQYPNNGPTLRVQALRLGTNLTREHLIELRNWVRGYASKNGRPETSAAYRLNA